MSRRPGCQARQHSDQMLCGPCGLAWDVGDPEPPACRQRASDAHADPDAPRVTDHVALPLELPLELAGRMADAYDASERRDPGKPAHAMRAAWRVFLDEVGG